MSNPPQQPPLVSQQQQQLRMMQQRVNTASPQPNGGLPGQQQAPFNLNMPAGVVNQGPSNPPQGGAPVRPPGGAPPLTPQQLNQMIELAKSGQLPKNQVEQLQKLMMSYNPNGAARPPAPAPQQQQQQQQPSQGPPQQQQQQQQQAMPSQATGPPMQRPPMANAAAQSSNQKMIAALQGLAAMSDAQRAQQIAANPQLGVLYDRWQAQRRVAVAQQAQQAQQAAANAATGAPNASNTGAGGQQANVRPQGNFAPNPAIPNLQLPPNRVRNPNAANMPAPIGNMQVRPNVPIQARPPPNQAQQQFQAQNQAARVGSPAVGAQNGQAGAASTEGPGAPNQTRPAGAAGASASINRTNSPLTVPASQVGPSPHPNQAGPRPTLSTGLPAGSMMGTPSLLQRSGQGWDEASRAGVQAKSDLGTIEGRKRKIREVLEEVEKGEKLEDGVEDLLLEVIDELIDSSTQFAARLAKHRGSNTLEVRDLQLHFERQHNIRIPGMGSDEINQIQSQSTRRHPALSQHAQRLQAVARARSEARLGESEVDRA